MDILRNRNKVKADKPNILFFKIITICGLVGALAWFGIAYYRDFTPYSIGSLIRSCEPVEKEVCYELSQMDADAIESSNEYQGVGSNCFCAHPQKENRNMLIGFILYGASLGIIIWALKIG